VVALHDQYGDWYSTVVLVARAPKLAVGERHRAVHRTNYLGTGSATSNCLELEDNGDRSGARDPSGESEKLVWSGPSSVSRRRTRSVLPAEGRCAEGGKKQRGVRMNTDKMNFIESIVGECAQFTADDGHKYKRCWST
jgi:hypothetical protein